MKYFPSLNYILLVSFVVFGLSSCYNDKEDLLYGNDDCNPVDVSFSKDIQPLINTTCNKSGCHVQGGTGNGIFDNYDPIKAKVDNGSFRQRVLVQKDMPPSTPLSNCQLKYIESWLNAGAPNN